MVCWESCDLSDPASANLCPELPNTHTCTQMPLLLWPGRRVLLVSRMPWAQALANLPLQQYIMNKKEAFDLLSIPLISLAGHVSRWPHSLQSWPKDTLFDLYSCPHYGFSGGTSVLAVYTCHVIILYKINKQYWHHLMYFPVLIIKKLTKFDPSTDTFN